MMINTMTQKELVKKLWYTKRKKHKWGTKDYFKWQEEKVMLYNRITRNVVCNCGHYPLAHFGLSGDCCAEVDGGKTCGCTWYHPNDKWIIKYQKIFGKKYCSLCGNSIKN